MSPPLFSPSLSSHSPGSSSCPPPLPADLYPPLRSPTCTSHLRGVLYLHTYEPKRKGICGQEKQKRKEEIRRQVAADEMK